MAAVVARLFGSAMSHVGRHKLLYGGSTLLAGGLAYKHHKDMQGQQATGRETSPAPESTPPLNPNDPQTYSATA